MSKRIQDTPFADLLPESIRHDSGIAAAATAFDPALRQLVLGVPNLLLFSRLGPVNSLGVADASGSELIATRRVRQIHSAEHLSAAEAGKDPNDSGQLSPVMQRLANAAGGLKSLSEAELELLAWQFHVDFRDAADTPEQLAEMVRQSIPWHRIKGTPASIHAALGVFGFGTPPAQDVRQRDMVKNGRPSGIVIEESLPGQHWATYQLGLPHAVDMDSVRRAVRVAEAMAPVRCRLGRVYNPEFDFRPAVWGTDRWADAWWSLYSGVPLPEDPDFPGTADTPLVSFGARLSLTSPPLDPRVAFGMASLMSFLAPYLDKPVWGRTLWGGIMPVNHPFIFFRLYSSFFGTALSDPPRIDRIRPSWAMGANAVSRAQAVYGEAGKSWSDTAAYGTVIVRRIEAPAVYSIAAYGDSQELSFEVLHELFMDRWRFLLPSWSPATPMSATTAHLAFRVPRRSVPVWGEAAWGDVFAQNRPFFGQTLLSGYFGERITDFRTWRGSWSGPWRKYLGIGRKRDVWSMGTSAVSRAQAVYGEAGKAWGDGTRYGTTVTRRIEAPAVYGAAAYGDSQGLKVEVLHELSMARSRYLLPPWNPDTPLLAAAVHAAYRIPRQSVPVWGEAAWGDVFAGNLPFFGLRLLPGYFGERLIDPRNWCGPWSGPWRKYVGLGRILPEWSMGANAVSRAQAVFGESGKAWSDGTRYGTTVTRRIEAPAVYGASAYGDSQGFELEVIHES